MARERSVAAHGRLHLAAHAAAPGRSNGAGQSAAPVQPPLVSRSHPEPRMEQRGILCGSDLAPSGSTVLPTPSYFRFDTGVTWRPTQNLELSVWGQNLLDGRHAEFNSFHASFLTEVPRSVLGKITWRFSCGHGGS